jgi:hypothetical protein
VVVVVGVLVVVVVVGVMLVVVNWLWRGYGRVVVGIV